MTTETPTGAPATSPALELIHTHGRDISVRYGEVELARYLYRSGHAQREAPRPYFHPLRTLEGELVSCYRPWDHIWHKGLSLALPHVADTNFWGGATYVRDRGYQQLDNNGSQDHRRFSVVEVDDVGEAVTVAEELDWRSQQDQLYLTEQRSWRLSLLAEFEAWTLSFTTRLSNVTDASLAFGSPTTHGRPSAGYGGFFWRGPRSFTGGKVFTPEQDDAEGARGEKGEWLAFVGVHDGSTRSSTVLFVDHPENVRTPTHWFVRADPFAAVCPAPFFYDELELPAGQTLTLSYDVVVAGAEWDRERVHRCVERLRTT